MAMEKGCIPTYPEYLSLGSSPAMVLFDNVFERSEESQDDILGAISNRLTSSGILFLMLLKFSIRRKRKY